MFYVSVKLMSQTTETDDKTLAEKKILEAAKDVFMQKGLEAASMSDIAKTAGISRTSLHYYFRTKEKLFREIFRSVVDGFMPQLGKIIRGNASVREKVEKFVDSYIDLLASVPAAPHFIINEIYRDPEGIVELFLSVESEHGNIAYAVHLLEVHAREHGLKDFDAQHFCLALYSQCVFPFVLSPVIKTALFSADPDRYAEFLVRLKKNITRTAVSRLYPEG